MKKLLYTTLLLLGITTYSTAQVSSEFVLENNVKVSNVKIDLVGRQLQVKMTADFTNAKIKSNNEVKITPRLVTNDKQLDLPSMVVAGRKSIIYRKRNTSYYAEENNLVFERRDKKNPQLINYKYMVDFEPWMNGADLNIIADDCGCSTTLLANNEYSIDKFKYIPKALNPSIRYIEPVVEKVKDRSYAAFANIDFAVAKYNIDPKFRNNATELEKIKASIEKIAVDGDMNISTVKLTGHSSPEGSYALNDRLSRLRTESIRTYLLNNLSRSVKPTIEVYNVAENWDGLAKAVESSNLLYKNDILRLISDVADLDLRERELKKLDNGKVYRELLQFYFPALRTTKYEVKYVIRQFTLEEARDLVWTDPEKLSLNEIFSVSKLYDTNSEDYGRLFDIAVKAYPSDHIANINASTSAIISKDYARAKYHLDKVLPHNRDQFYYNNLGVYYLYNEQYDNAINTFEKAIELNSEDAKINLEMTHAKVEELILLGKR